MEIFGSAAQDVVLAGWEEQDLVVLWGKNFQTVGITGP
jgi:hypothetical protein